MNNVAVLGAVFGDEGKGRVVHEFSKNYDWIIRFSGGANAGHTIYRDGKKYVHNLLPSADFRYKNIKSYLGSGMVIDLAKLEEEMLLAEKDFPGVARSIYIDTDAFLVLEKHKEVDKSTNSHIGSTNRGIGPSYKDKVGRAGIRIIDLMNVHGANVELWQSPLKQIIYNLVNLGVKFTDVMSLYKEFSDSKILFEGAQGVLLDLNHGTYPYVSCGDSTLAGIIASGFVFCMPQKVYGVSKVYSTRVGEGPFPTEIFGEEAENLRKIGNEYGATTGRPRRVGWLDIPALKYAAIKAGINSLILTKFDILNGFKEIKVCNHYINNYKLMPTSPHDFTGAVPTFTLVSGWTDAQIDEQIKPFIKKIEEMTNLPVEYITRGTNELDIIQADELK